MANRGLAAQLVGKTFAIEEPAANVTPADGAGFNISAVEAVAFEVDVVLGTQGTINVTFQQSSTTDVNASYSTIPNELLEVPFGQTGTLTAGVLTVGFALAGKRYYGYKGNAKFVRMIASGASGTPDHKLSLSATANRRRHIGGTP